MQRTAARTLHAALEPEYSTMAPLGTDTPIGAALRGTVTPTSATVPAAREPEDSTMAPLGTDTPIGAAPFGTDTPIGVALPGTDTPIGPTGERDHWHDLSLVEAV